MALLASQGTDSGVSSGNVFGYSTLKLPCLSTRLSPDEQKRFTNAAVHESTSTIPIEQTIDPINYYLNYEEKRDILRFIIAQCEHQKIRLVDLEFNLFDNKLEWDPIIAMLLTEIRQEYGKLLTVDNLQAWYRLRIRTYKYRFDSYAIYHTATEVLFKWYRYAIDKGYASMYKSGVVFQPQMGTAPLRSKCPNLLTEWLELEKTKSAMATSFPQKSQIKPLETAAVIPSSPMFSSSSETEVGPPPPKNKLKTNFVFGYTFTKKSESSGDEDESEGIKEYKSIGSPKDFVEFLNAQINIQKTIKDGDWWTEAVDNLKCNVDDDYDEYQSAIIMHPDIDMVESTPERVEEQTNDEWSTFCNAGAEGAHISEDNLFKHNLSDSEPTSALPNISSDETPSLNLSPSKRLKVDLNVKKNVVPPPRAEDAPANSGQRRRSLKPQILRRSTRITRNNKKP